MASLVGRRLLFVAAAAAAWRGVRRLVRHLRRRRFDGLDGVVSFSSRIIAAVRAAETARADALVVDPLAAVLAGHRAMARQAQQAEPDSSTPAPPAGTPAEQQQQRLVPRLVLRTCFFDDATLAAVGQPPARAAAVLAPLLQFLQQHPQLSPCTQVVMLGAGMDTRPWRLALGPHVRWFEVDRADVLAAKQQTLTRAGASFVGAAAAAPHDHQTQQQQQQQQQQQAGNTSSSSSKQQHALRVGGWACASADLQLPGWVARLAEAGLDPQQRTAWVAEGLLYYLEPDSVGPMLQEAARVSVPGSLIITNFILEEGLALLHGGPAARRAAAKEAAAAGESGGSGGSGGAANSSSTSSGPKTDAGMAARDLRRAGLLDHFKWGCPSDCEQFFRTWGWELLLRHSWKQASKLYSWKPQVNAGSAQRSHTQEVQLVVGVVAAAAGAQG